MSSRIFQATETVKYGCNKSLKLPINLIWGSICIAFKGFELIETSDGVVKLKVFTNVYDLIMFGCCN